MKDGADSDEVAGTGRLPYLRLWQRRNLRDHGPLHERVTDHTHRSHGLWSVQMQHADNRIEALAENVTRSVRPSQWTWQSGPCSVVVVDCIDVVWQHMSVMQLNPRHMAQTSESAVRVSRIHTMTSRREASRGHRLFKPVTQMPGATGPNSLSRRRTWRGM